MYACIVQVLVSDIDTDVNVHHNGADSTPYPLELAVESGNTTCLLLLLVRTFVL